MSEKKTWRVGLSEAGRLYWTMEVEADDPEEAALLAERHDGWEVEDETEFVGDRDFKVESVKEATDEDEEE